AVVVIAHPVVCTHELDAVRRRVEGEDGGPAGLGIDLRCGSEGYRGGDIGDVMGAAERDFGEGNDLFGPAVAPPGYVPGGHEGAVATMVAGGGKEKLSALRPGSQLL